MIVAGALTGAVLGVVENYSILANGTTPEVARAAGGTVAYAVFGAFAGAALWHAMKSRRS